MPTNTPSFDSFASDYDQALNQGLSVSGEDKNYFARGRIAWLKRRLDRMRFPPANIMDFGCGTGSSTPFFLEWTGLSSLLGVDVSDRSLDVARRLYGSNAVSFRLMADHKPDGSRDLIFCNGVFHHIPLDQRPSAMKFIHDSLRPGGLFALWENNPWNPGTRYVMAKIPFDRDAITLSPTYARNMLQQAGFQILRTDFLFYFPRMLKFLRPAEALLRKIPLGAQFMALGRKP